ncbi:hypothetical protein [Mycobacterium parmense]|uniref:Uncharacterized protein n=1 Tax=Mycobacterium parmense TaxID=185642 RepID=A0A7I7YWT5_9MYCO|nr:hypothetical protein [Mycobacterium parmense]MCV7350101.1 hypothetical protein [Mycobacterium parmense]ORW59365.1 hypothetical protein AWC20_10550 [Mycobacterium parmense]BBZ46365.1 hypothetical protein MPRM_36460 [Mycobacterium parmense]
MVTPTISIMDRAGATRTPRAAGDCLRYRLDVIATSAADVVQSAGGWLFDRVMAGWQVTVLLPQRCDSRSLRIIGAEISGLESFDPAAARCRSLAVSAEAFAADARTRDKVLESLDDRLTEVALWGEGWPIGVNRAMTRAQYELSAAARTFKAQALSAAGIDCATIASTEALLCDAAFTLGPEVVRLDR